MSRKTVPSFAPKLGTVTETRGRKLNGSEFLAKIIVGMHFAGGINARDGQPALITPAAI